MVALRRLSHVRLILKEMRTEACAEQFDLKPASVSGKSIGHNPPGGGTMNDTIKLDRALGL
jgi:hypothetical protein